MAERSAEKMVRVAYLLSHPIQYQSPLLRSMAQTPGLDLTVLYTSGFSVQSYRDEGFGRTVRWDVPLLDGYRYEFLPRILDNDTISFFRPLNRGIFKRLHRGNFDVLWIHGYSTLNSWIAMLAARLFGIPVLMRTDSTLIDHPRGQSKLALKALFFRLLRPFVFGVLSVGERNKEYWRHHLGTKLPIFPIPYAVDNEFFRERCRAASGTREDLRRELGLDLERPVILFASKLLARKRCMDLVDAYLRMVERSQERRLAPYLLIVGDGEERLKIEQRLEQVNSDGVRMLGFRNQSELPRYYDLCDIFVLPSVYEPWGLVINEVMNAGRPVIVSDQVGCQPDLVEDGDNGRVFPARNVAALADILETLSSDAVMRQRMGQRSLARIRKFDFDSNIRGLTQAFAAARDQCTHK